MIMRASQDLHSPAKYGDPDRTSKTTPADGGMVDRGEFFIPSFQGGDQGVVVNRGGQGSGRSVFDKSDSPAIGGGTDCH